MKTLSIGAGNRRHEGAVHCDIRPLKGIDVVHDLNVHPYPFEDMSFELIIAFDIIEHLDNVIKCIEECHRILIPTGHLWIHTNYWNQKQAFTDPTHRHFFSEESFDYFCPATFLGQTYDYYSPCKFKKIGWRMDCTEMIIELEKL